MFNRDNKKPKLTMNRNISLVFYFLLTVGTVAVRARAAQVTTAPLSNSNIKVGDYSVIERGPHHATWQRVLSRVEHGRTIAVTNSYVELASGLSFFNPKLGKWQASREEWQAYSDGIVAEFGRQKVRLANNLNEGGSVEILTANGEHIVSNPVGIGLYDPTDGKQILIAEIKDCAPQWGRTTNEIVFRDCFAGLRGSMRYLYTRSGLHQHFVLEQGFALPQGFSSKTRVEFYTELASETHVSAESVSILGAETDPLARSLMVDPDFTDTTLGFGDIKMGPGRAFILGNGQERDSIPVGKHIEVISNRPVLIESVKYSDLRPLISRLATITPVTSPALATAGPHVLKQLAVNAHAKRSSSQSSRRVAMLASNPVPDGSAIIDYETVTSATNVVFRADTTYYVSGPVSLAGANVIEGGAVIKFTNSSLAGINITGSLECKTGPYRIACLTSSADDSLGTIISGSSGNPTNLNGATYITHWSGAGITYSYLRFSYAGIGLFGQVQAIWHSQFVNCGTGFQAADSDARLYNVLFSKCGICVGDSYADSLYAEHVTADQANWFYYTSFGNPGSVTNSVLTGVTNLGANVSLYNSYQYTSGSGIYQTLGAASYYLAAGSALRNSGTTNINSTLLASLSQKTTYPPLVVTTTIISNDTTYFPQAQRDSDGPDAGYHYDPVDYAFGDVWFKNANFTIQPGTSICGFGNTVGHYGISLQSGSTLRCEGTPSAPIHFSRCTMVQEQSNTNWSKPVDLVLGPYNGELVKPVARFRFSDWSMSSLESYEFRTYLEDIDVSFKDCEFRAGNIFSYFPNLVFTNCLFERTYHNYDDDLEIVDMSPAFYSCLFYGGTLHLNHLYGGDWEFRNNMFDQTAISQTGSVSNDFNGYLTGTTRLNPTNGNHDVIATISYKSGPLGTYYQPTNSAFINLGNTNADLLGFYHYTTTTNLLSGVQVKETNSVVDIGFHYVAVGVNGQPIDTDGDLVSDFLEDANGNGSVDSGETDWHSFTDLGLKVMITRPRSGSLNP
jgi:hypothetical protein